MAVSAQSDVQQSIPSFCVFSLPQQVNRVGGWSSCVFFMFVCVCVSVWGGGVMSLLKHQYQDQFDITIVK